MELFQERLPKGAIRYLHGSPFDVEQTSETLEKVFQNAVASSNAPLLLGYGFISLLIGRQNDYIQSLQTFVSALKVRLGLAIRNTYLTLVVCLYVSLLCESPKYFSDVFNGF